MTTEDSPTEGQTEGNTEVAPASPAATEAKKRKRWRFENGNAIVRDVNGTETTYAVTSLPEKSVHQLAFVGMVALLSRGADEVAAYAKIMSGDFSVASKPPAEKVISPWRIAIAMARFDAKKKSQDPVTMEQAKAWAADLDAKVVKAYKTDVAVVRNYNKLASTPCEGVPALTD